MLECRALAWRKDVLQRLCGRAMDSSMQSGRPGQTPALAPDLHVIPEAVIGGMTHPAHSKSTGSLNPKSDKGAGAHV